MINQGETPVTFLDETFGLLFRCHRQRPDCVDVSRVVDGVVVDQFWCTPPPDAEQIEAEARRWLRRRVGAEPPEPTRCAACGTELVPALPRDTDVQFASALVVTLSGGYAMFIDPPDGADLRALLCGHCATELCDQAPWLRALVDDAEAQRVHR